MKSNHHIPLLIHDNYFFFHPLIFTIVTRVWPRTSKGITDLILPLTYIDWTPIVEIRSHMIATHYKPLLICTKLQWLLKRKLIAINDIRKGNMSFFHRWQQCLTFSFCRYLSQKVSFVNAIKPTTHVTN
jgi:hypothetical protein